MRGPGACWIALLCAIGAAGAAASIGRAEPAAGPRPQITRVVHQPPSELPSIGPRYAPVTIEFYANLGDGSATGQVHRLLLELAERHPLRLRVVYRLVSAGEQSNPHLEAAQEAFVQGRFRAFVDEMYGTRFVSPRSSELMEIAERAGLDTRKLAQALDDGRHAPVMAANHFHRKRHRVRQMPGLLINGVYYDKRPRSIDELEAAYDEAYARATELLARGVPLEDLYARLVLDAIAARPEPVVGPGAVDGLRLGERPPVGPAPLIFLPSTGPKWSRGPDGAPVQIVFFCNFQTRNCGQMGRTLDEIAAAYPEARLEFRPLFDPGDRRQDQARALHELAVCADEQHRFWSFYDHAMREARQGEALLGASTTEEVAATLELDEKLLARCLESPATRRKVEKARRRTRAAGVRHTPAVVIGGRLYTGTKSFDELAGLIDRQLMPGVLGRLAPE